VDEPVEAVAEPAPGTVTGPTIRSLWRRYRVALLVLAIVLVGAGAIALARSRGAGGRLDPRSAQPDGGRALATLLEERGVRVDRVTDPDQASGDLDARTVVLVPIPGQLGSDAARRLGGAAAGTVVLVNPAGDDLAAITERVRVAGTTSLATRAPGCDDPAATAAGDALSGGSTFDADGGESCYGEGGSAPLVTGTTSGGARLVVLGTGAVLTNARLDEDGNAALALTLLGADGSADELRWLLPAPGSAAADESPGSILPDWVVPALLQLLFAGVLLALWRGRRLGPPVVEPLPVVVRAAEAVEGRARLYRRAQARDRAATALRSGALARMVPRLGIDSPTGGEPPPAAVVAAVAARSGRPDAAVHAALFGGPPPDDPALVTLAGTLDSIVRDTLDPEGPHQ
jgi:hypothetical protein